MFIEIKTTAVVPTNDYVFKRIFGRVGNEDITKSFVSSIIEKELTSIDLSQNTILEKDFINDKLGILDIKAILDSNILCDIEMQILYNKNIEKRILFYWSKLYSQSIRSDDDYINLKKTISIIIADFKMNNLSEIQKFHTEWKIREKDYRKTLLTDILEIHIIELPKLKEALANGKDLKENKELLTWSKFLLNPDKLEVSEMKENKNIQRAKEELDKMRNDEYEERIAELRQKAILDHKYFRHDGFEEGFEKGSKQEKLEIAKKMLNAKIKIADIVEITGLTKEEIEKL